MIGILSITIGLVFMLLLVAWLFWTPEDTKDRQNATREVVIDEASLRRIAERICSEEDWQFVALHNSDLKSEYLRDRKRLLQHWLRKLRSMTVDSVRAYRSAVSSNALLDPLMELRIATNYLTFLLLWQTMRGFVWFTNPPTTRFLILRVLSISEEIFLCSRNRIEQS